MVGAGAAQLPDLVEPVGGGEPVQVAPDLIEARYAGVPVDTAGSVQVATGVDVIAGVQESTDDVEGDLRVRVPGLRPKRPLAAVRLRLMPGVNPVLDDERARPAAAVAAAAPPGQDNERATVRGDTGDAVDDARVGVAGDLE